MNTFAARKPLNAVAVDINVDDTEAELRSWQWRLQLFREKTTSKEDSRRPLEERVLGGQLLSHESLCRRLPLPRPNNAPTSEYERQYTPNWDSSSLKAFPQVVPSGRMLHLDTLGRFNYKIVVPQ